MQIHTQLVRLLISIHALLAESDITAPTSSGKREISIHALLAESDRSYRVHYGAV